MRTMHPTLLIGPADWDQVRMPRDEFNARINALWTEFRQARGVIVFGNAADHGALAYLTNFTPKLEAALALIPREGEPQLLVGGGVNMIDAARPLTWIHDLKPLRNAGNAVAGWASGLPLDGMLLVLGGDAMPFQLRRSIDDALGGDVAVEDGSEALRTLMLRKSEREYAVIRKACVCLDAAVSALTEVSETGAGVSDALLAAERAAYRQGAQDVRSLFSLDHGRTLQPFDMPVEWAVDPLQTYLAVRHTGYWAEGFVRASSKPDPICDKASDVLLKMIATAKPGAVGADLWKIIDAECGSLQFHPIAAGTLGNAVGLSLEEPPLLTRDCDARLETGGIYTLRTGLVDAVGGAIVSAMVSIGDAGGDIIWSAGERR